MPDEKPNYAGVRKKMKETDDPIEALSIGIPVLSSLYKDTIDGNVKPELGNALLEEFSFAVERTKNKDAHYNQEREAALAKLKELSDQMAEAHKMMQSQRVTHKGKMEEMETISKDQTESLENRYKSDIDSLKSNFATEAEKGKNVIDRLMTELGEKEVYVQELQSRGVTLETEKFMTEEKLKKIQEEADEMNKEIHASRDKMKELEAKSQAELQAAQDKMKELEVKTQEYDGIMQQIKKGEYVTQVAVEAKEQEALQRGIMSGRVQASIDSVAPSSKYLEYELLHISRPDYSVLDELRASADIASELREDVQRKDSEIGMKDGQVAELQSEVRSLLSQIKNAERRAGDSVEREKYTKALEQIAALNEELMELRKRVPAGK